MKVKVNDLQPGQVVMVGEGHGLSMVIKNTGVLSKYRNGVTWVISLNDFHVLYLTLPEYEVLYDIHNLKNILEVLPSSND